MIRVLQPSLLTWLYGDERPADIILPWIENYLEGKLTNIICIVKSDVKLASYSTDRDKPAGVLPSAISWPSGLVGGWK